MSYKDALAASVEQFNKQHGSWLARATILSGRPSVELRVQEQLRGRDDNSRIYPLVAVYTLVFENVGPDSAEITASLSFGPHNGITATGNDEAEFLAHAVELKRVLAHLLAPALDAYIYERQRQRIIKGIAILTQQMNLDPVAAKNSPHLWLAIATVYYGDAYTPPHAKHSIDHEWLLDAGVLCLSRYNETSVFILSNTARALL